MNKPYCEDSHTLVQRLLVRDLVAIGEFARRHRLLLEAGHSEMGERLTTQFPPGCRVAFEGLTPHVAERCGFGYIEKSPRLSLRDFLPTLVLPDLYTVSACLARDQSANNYFMYLVDGRVRPKMLQKFANRLGEGRTGEIVDNMFSRCWSADGEIATADEEPDRHTLDSQTTKNRPRLAAYYGGCTLLSWLYAIAMNALKDACRARRSRDRSLEPPCRDNDDEDASSRHDPIGSSADNDRLEIAAAKYHCKLRQSVDAYVASLHQGGVNPTQEFRVAYLWIVCRVMAKDIAQELNLTKARISQITAKIKDDCARAAGGILHCIAHDAEQCEENVAALLKEDLPGAGTPVLFEQICAAIKSLQQTRPELAHVVYLTTFRQRTAAEVAIQRRESLEKVQNYLHQFATWRRQIVQGIVDKLHSESGIDRDLLGRRVEAAFSNWVETVSNAANESETHI